MRTLRLFIKHVVLDPIGFLCALLIPCMIVFGLVCAFCFMLGLLRLVWLVYNMG